MKLTTLFFLAIAAVYGQSGATVDKTTLKPAAVQTDKKAAPVVDTKPSAEAPKAEAKEPTIYLEGETLNIADLENKLSKEIPDFKEALAASKKHGELEKELDLFREAMKINSMNLDDPLIRDRSTIAAGLKHYVVATKNLENQGMDMTSLEILAGEINLAKMRGKINLRESLYGQEFVQKQQRGLLFQISAADTQLYNRAMNFMARQYNISDPKDPRPVLVSTKRLPWFFMNDAAKKLRPKK